MQHVEINYQKALFRVEALFSAGRRTAGICSASFQEKDDSIVATLTFDGEQINAEKAILEFNQLVIRYQEKIAVAERTSVIRQLILAQAFEPCENIDEVVEHVVKGQNEQL